MCAVGHCTWPASSCKKFKHLMVSVRIMFCLESPVRIHGMKNKWWWWWWVLKFRVTETFWIWSRHFCIWNIRFQLNSCLLQISVEESDVHTSIKVTFYFYITFVSLSGKSSIFSFVVWSFWHIYCFPMFFSVLSEMMYRCLAVTILSKLSLNNMATFATYPTLFT